MTSTFDPLPPGTRSEQVALDSSTGRRGRVRGAPTPRARPGRTEQRGIDSHYRHAMSVHFSPGALGICRGAVDPPAVCQEYGNYSEPAGFPALDRKRGSFSFVRDPGVEGTNHRAERAL